MTASYRITPPTQPVIHTVAGQPRAMLAMTDAQIAARMTPGPGENVTLGPGGLLTRRDADGRFVESWRPASPGVLG